MKKVVIYNSQTGFTKKYAEWIAEGLDADIFPLKETKKIDLSKYDAIVFGSWCMAGSLVKLDWFVNELKSLQNKRVAIFACGATPRKSPDIDVFLSTKFTDEVLKNVKVFYCQSGLNYDRMNLASRTSMKLFAKMLNSKKDAPPEEIEMISHNYDISDRKYADEVVSWIECCEK